MLFLSFNGVLFRWLKLHFSKFQSMLTAVSLIMSAKALLDKTFYRKQINDAHNQKFTAYAFTPEGAH